MLNPESNNLTCHWCRKSKNRPHRTRKFICCNRCIKTYCTMCISTHPHIKPDEFGCIYCREQCCCLSIFCNKKHMHCHTYNRTRKRHAEYGLKLIQHKKSVKYDMKFLEVQVIKTSDINIDDISITEEGSV